LLVFDEDGFAEALDSAIRRAYDEGPFLAMPVIAGRRAALALEAAGAIVSTEAAYCKRRGSLDPVRERRYVLTGKTLAERETLTKKEKDSMCDVLLAADDIVLR
jgi:hypothetical protein